MNIVFINFFFSYFLVNQLHKDDTIYMESYEKLLESWMSLIQNVDSLPPGSLCVSATQVFNSYLQCHLAAPDGIRTRVG